jgi:2-aminoadipate transaminase
MVKFSNRMDNMKDSAGVIRGLFGAMTNPGMISFGGGALAKESLPVDIKERYERLRGAFLRAC